MLIKGSEAIPDSFILAQKSRNRLSQLKKELCATYQEDRRWQKSPLSENAGDRSATPTHSLAHAA